MNNFFKSFGPGLLMAGACIGVSHVVQSTRAGADYGFALLWVVIAVNIFKFPFYEFAPRFVAATGENLLQGYRRLGRFPFYLFCVLSFMTMFIIQAAVTIVTAGLVANLIPLGLNVFQWSLITLIVCAAILIVGHYAFLDKLMKVMMVLLSLGTVIAVVFAVTQGHFTYDHSKVPEIWNPTGIAFLIALMGWMPSNIDLSVWHSLWTQERAKETGHQPTVKEAQLDFHIGYWGTMVMAIMFVSLGALVMFSSGEKFSDSSIAFTGQVISMYTSTLGQWTFPIIAFVATMTMFSTTITVLDAFPRVVKEACLVARPQWKENGDKIYIGWILFLSATALLIIGKFMGQFKNLIDIATTLSFLSGPAVGLLNYRVVTADFMPEKARPSKGLRIFSWCGFTFLTLFGIVFILWRFFVR